MDEFLNQHSNYRALFYLLLGFVPSIIWLGYYLKKDRHPEPKKMILWVFVLGMLATLPVLAIERLAQHFLGLTSISESGISYALIYFFAIVALVEEAFKYLGARFGAFSSKNLDEPVDFMVYMVVAALGFAAMENMLYMWRLLDVAQAHTFDQILWVNIFRSVGAIFLHGLASGLFGYFVALSFLRKKYYLFYTLLGLFIATGLHGVFNFYIYTLGDKSTSYVLIPTLILVILAFFVSLAFRKLRNTKSVCKT